MEAEKEDLTARYERAALVVGRYKTRRGERDIAVNHDRYLNQGPRW